MESYIRLCISSLFYFHYGLLPYNFHYQILKMRINKNQLREKKFTSERIQTQWQVLRGIIQLEPQAGMVTLQTRNKSLPLHCLQLADYLFWSFSYINAWINSLYHSVPLSLSTCTHILKATSDSLSRMESTYLYTWQCK